MRDRRNTNVSTSSTGSSLPAYTDTTRDSLEKGYCGPSPPLSPSLPPYDPSKHDRRRGLLRPHWRAALQLVSCICGMLFCLWSLASLVHGYHAKADAEFSVRFSKTTDGLRSVPGALYVPDAPMGPRWTVAIPRDLGFPLPAEAYRHICRGAQDLSAAIRKTSPSMVSGRPWWQTRSYSVPDATYLDVDEVEQMGLLSNASSSDMSEVCEKSLTFVLGDDDVSFGNSLLQLWLSYGLAKKEGRAFFLDDSRWAWKSYASYFSPPPSPSCQPPPAHHIVPCPHSARHIVVSSATLPWTFGAEFEHEYSSAYRHGAAKQRRIYDMIRVGYDDLFHLNDDDASYVAARMRGLRENMDASAPLVGLQIRRGDLHPHEFQYNRDYLPLERYAEAARTLTHSSARQQPALVLASSDDPDIASSPELAPLELTPAQDRILLATKSTLDRTLPPMAQKNLPPSAYRKHVDENAGWEGGFYSAAFTSLAPELRVFVGRAYVLDLAVLSEVGSRHDGIVCAVSAAGCRILGVTMGWERLQAGRWVNVDDGREWSWDGLGR